MQLYRVLPENPPHQRQNPPHLGQKITIENNAYCSRKKKVTPPCPTLGRTLLYMPSILSVSESVSLSVTKMSPKKPF